MHIFSSLEEMRKNRQVEGLSELVLGVVQQMTGEAYAVPICTKLLDAGRDTSLSTIYSVLDGLEKQGFVVARQGEPLEERGGRARTYYSITGEGIKALLEAGRVRQVVGLTQAIKGAF